MAAPTLTTTVSRRSMLAGGVASLAAPMPALPAGQRPRLGCHHPDAGLLRLIARAYDCLAAHHEADALCNSLHDAMRSHPAFPGDLPATQAERDRCDELMDRLGIVAAEDRCEELHERYEEALATAFALPADTLPGFHGKLGLAIAALRQEQSGVNDAADCTYLNGTLCDLERLAVFSMRLESGS